MSYDQIGFDQFLNRELPDIRTQYLEADASYLLPQLSGSLIGGGITTSADGKVSINWDTGEVIFSDGGRGRVFLGKIQGSDDYGIKIVDASGNIVMQSNSLVQTAGIEAGAVTADKITVTQLAALAVNTGTLVVDESITAGDGTVILDDDGILVNEGKIVVKNEDESTIIDAKGLVGEATFPFEAKNAIVAQTLGGIGDWQAVENVSQTFNLTRATTVLFFCNFLVTTVVGVNLRLYRLAADGIAVSGSDRLAAGGPLSISLSGNAFLGIGTHTFDLQYNQNVGQTHTFESIYKNYLIMGN